MTNVSTTKTTVHGGTLTLHNTVAAEPGHWLTFNGTDVQGLCVAVTPTDDQKVAVTLDLPRVAGLVTVTAYAPTLNRLFS